MAGDNSILRLDISGVPEASKAKIDDAGNVIIPESSAKPANPTGAGALWIKDDSTTAFHFTASDGTDYNLLSFNPVKRPCKVATTANHGRTGTANVDGVSISAGDRILVWNQSVANENGIYEAAAGAWSRAPDFDDATDDRIEAGIEIYVQEGDSYSRTKFFLVTTVAITIGATSLEFIPMGGLARTDALSTVIIASKAFTGGMQVNDSGFIDMRDHTDISVYFMATNITSQDSVIIVAYWSDDGSTIGWGADDYAQRTDFNIVDNADGTFGPKNYVAKLTTAGGELAADTGVLLTFPKAGGACKIGVMGTADGVSRFSVRTQRLVR